MGTFDFENKPDLSAECRNKSTNEECIIAQKIFDQLRFQKCLSPAIIGPARTARNISNSNGDIFCEGDVIVPPCNAVSVSIKNTKLSKIDIISKKKNPFRSGCWDVEVKYTFTYTLDFRNCEGVCIGTIEATNSYNQKVTLFGGATGSSDAEVTIATDLYHCFDTSSPGPFVSVEGTGVGLLAELKYASNCSCSCTPCSCTDSRSSDGRAMDDISFGAPIAVDVTLGLFSIIRMFRTTNLLVRTSGNCIPEEIRCATNPDPCDFFDKLEFPMEIFEPKTSINHCRGLGGCSSPGMGNSNNDCSCNNNIRFEESSGTMHFEDNCTSNPQQKNNYYSARSKNNMQKR